MVRSLVAASALFALGFVASHSVAQEAPQPDVLQVEGIVAIVNDEPITFTDVRQRARMLLLTLGGTQPTQEQIQQLTTEALDQLIDEKLQLQEASEYDVEISDAEIADSISSMAQQSGLTREALVSSLLSSGINPTSLEAQSRAEIAWRRIMSGLYGSRIRISDGQITEQLRRLKAAATKEQYQLSEIFLYAPTPEDKTQALAAATSIKEQLINGAPFEVAAQRFSSAPTAATGGSMGWVPLEDLDPLLANAVTSTPWPGLTEPVTVDNGIYVVAVISKREPAEQTSLVDLVRIAVNDGSEAELKAATEQITGCDNINTVIEGNDNLRASELSDVNVENLGPEGKTMVMNTEIDQATDIFAQAGTLAVMYVCNRKDNVDNLPSRDQVENRLYNEQLGMVAQRSLRNLRREATIIRR
jgi:peptidyl-prolyl cis-trans isomerase SurA